MSESSINAIWVNPLAFDALVNGPPYLPERGRVLTASETNPMPALVAWFNGAPMAELGVLVAALRAAAFVHQTHHWQARGGNFYGDHLLFGRLYDESQGFVDQLAERSVGAGSRNLVCPKQQVQLLGSLVQAWCGVGSEDPSPTKMVSLSLAIELFILRALKGARERLEANGNLSDGIDNLLQGVADKHEEFTYLLQQRLEAKIASYDRRR
jgi:DNA-binding ferritin-like protein